MDNGTMIESFKFLNYYQLATGSLVSKRFRNLIRTHRHKLALLDVNEIYMFCYVDYPEHSITMFNKELSPKEYNKLIARNGYSKQVPLGGRIAGKENGYITFTLRANVCQNPNNCHDIATTVFNSQVELKNENWPMFQHSMRILMDPFIYIRSLTFYSPNVLGFLAGAMNSDHDRLRCKQLVIDLNDDTKKYVVWIKDHIRCNEFKIHGDGGSKCDEELIDFIMTGAPCTSAIKIKNYVLSKVLIDFMQKFTGLRNSDEHQMVESILSDFKNERVIEKLKRKYAKFIDKEEKHVERHRSRQIIGFINNDIQKKLTFSLTHFSFIPSRFSIEITNL
ncbi:hypothetical protein DdX_16982 [Ditylenchus destructor]|uniref:F-box domain-containing protein n=1 Tax=Ditylenchus destructor TaxID=166010 RepID=A0AAD4MPU2_9BILA|nr:hypothetical protein DdX_16982 [Ditylenchus destructor]